jgi:hypothetical protein
MRKAEFEIPTPIPYSYSYSLFLLLFPIPITYYLLPCSQPLVLPLVLLHRFR